MTLLYHHMINVLSSHDKTHYHVMYIICLVIEWDIRIPLCYMTYDQSNGLSHSICIRNSLDLETTFSNQNIISYFNPWINHILLYVVDLTNQQWNLSLWYLRSWFRCATLILRDLQFSLALWLQSSLPHSKFISISWKMTPHLTCSYN